LVFLVETLGINQIGELAVVSVAAGPWLVMKSSHALDGLRPEKFKMDFLIRHSRPFSLQYGKGNFTVNSVAVWRTLAAVSNPFFKREFHELTRMCAWFELVQIRVIRVLFSCAVFTPTGAIK
jgi:hypothetical protein